MLAAFVSRYLHSSFNWAHVASALLVFAIIFLLPNASLLPQAWSGNPHNEKRIWQVLLTCTYGLMLILSPAARLQWHMTLAGLPRIARITIIAVLALGLLSAAFSARPDAALLELTNFGMLCVLALGIATGMRQTGQSVMQLFCWSLLAMALAYEMRFLMGVLVMRVEQAPWTITDLFTGFVNVRFFNQVQTWTLPLLALPWLWLAGRFPALRSTCFAVLALWWLLLFFSAGRGVLMAVCGGCLITLAVFRRNSLPWLKIQIAAALTALTAYFALAHFTVSSAASSGVQALPQRLAHPFEDAARLRLWQDAWELFLQHPLLGAGPMHYAYHFRDLSLHPHNSVLQLVSEWGLLATLLLLLLGLWGILAWTRQSRGLGQASNNREAPVRVACLASVSGAALHSLVSGLIVMPLSQLLAASVIGLMLGDHLASRVNSTVVISQKRHDIGFVSALAISVLILGCLTVITLFEPRGPLSTSGQVPHNPRFWLPGQLEPAEENIFSRILKSS